jgi:phytoene synthase
MTGPLGPDRRLALAYVPARQRRALEALWLADAAMGQVLSNGSDPMITRIRLAWWREAFERLDEAPPPAEPTLTALACHVLPTGISGSQIAQLEEGWSAIAPSGLLGDDDIALYARARGRGLFSLSQVILGGQGAEAEGALWSLADLARHTSHPEEQKRALALICSAPPAPRLPGSLRVLGMLGQLARRDAMRGASHIEPEGSPARIVRLLRYRVTGR